MALIDVLLFGPIGIPGCDYSTLIRDGWVCAARYQAGHQGRM